MKPIIDFSDFAKVDMRVGSIIYVELFEEAIKPAYKLKIDFGELGVKKTSAQLVKNYTIDDLKGEKIVAVVNFPPKQIANFLSECLVLGAVDDEGNVTLLTPLKSIENGLKIA